jgi:aryl-alcohol dehydrogenase-like predicted oxidoreductase
MSCSSLSPKSARRLKPVSGLPLDQRCNGRLKSAADGRYGMPAPRAKRDEMTMSGCLHFRKHPAWKTAIAMETRKLRGTDLTVSRICLGTMAFGSAVDGPDAMRIVDRCVDAGVNFFDTANVYNGGRAETILSSALQGRRHRVVLATKVGGKMGDGIHQSGLSADAISTNIEHSLRRLQTDYIDVCYLHLPDRSTPLEETLRAMEDMVTSGKVRYPGTSNYAAWEACRILWLSEARGYRRYPVCQSPYNLLARSLESELLPFCNDLGVSLIAYNVFAGGLLTNEPNEATASKTRYWRPAYVEAATKLRSLAQRGGRPLTALAINWLLHHTATECAVLGPGSVEQLEQSLDALRFGSLPDDVVTECNAVSADLAGMPLRYHR